jgi:hypothetical protein
MPWIEEEGHIAQWSNEQQTKRGNSTTIRSRLQRSLHFRQIKIFIILCISINIVRVHDFSI